MKKAANTPIKYDSLTAIHRELGMPAPKHPLISLINSADPALTGRIPRGPHVLNYYKISYKPPFSGKIKYGQSYYDFDEGGLLFAAPGQVIGSNEDRQRNNTETNSPALILLIHPDFFLHHPLARKISQYGFFSYSTNEALHLSEEEKNIILSIFQMIERELNSRIDDLSQDVMLSQLELLFNYADRFYKRQFITRKVVSNDLLQQLETIMDEYLSNENNEGLPTVQYLAAQLHLSPGYLSDMLRSLLGQNAQQYIHDKLIAKSRELLSTTNMSVSAIAFQLGFEHSQSFSKFFKIKTKVSPMQFRQSFN